VWQALLWRLWFIHKLRNHLHHQIIADICKRFVRLLLKHTPISFWKKRRLRISKFAVKKCQKWQEREPALSEHAVRVCRLPAISDILGKSAEAAGFLVTFFPAEKSNKANDEMQSVRKQYKLQAWERGTTQSVKKQINNRPYTKVTYKYKRIEMCINDDLIGERAEHYCSFGTRPILFEKKKIHHELIWREEMSGNRHQEDRPQAA
jgi:hypothetical protein